MKRHILTLLALGATLMTAGFAFGQAPKAGAAPAAAAAAATPTQQRVVRIGTLNGVKANQEFQSNVQLLQGQRQSAIEIDTNLKKETDSKKKKELQTQLDAILAKLNENNDKMQKAYGFSLARNYTLEIETAHIYMLVTEEEAAKIEKAQKEEDQKKAKEQKAPKAKK